MELNTQKRTMTMQEFMQTVNVENADQARRYLKTYQWVIGILVAWFILVEVIAVEVLFAYVDATAAIITFAIGRLMYGVLFVLFVGMTIYLLGRVNVSKWNAIWCWILAPISWIPLYQMIAKPLKIVTGDLALPVYRSEEEIAQHQDKLRNANHRYWIIFFSVIFGLFFFLFACFLILVIAS